MNRIIIVSCLLLMSISSWSQQSTFPFVFMAPDIESIVPFTEVELRDFSNRHISFIEKSWPDGYTVYYFKDSLLLTDTTYHYSRRGKPTVDETENFTYDSRNRLVSKEFLQERSTTRDTITYDEMNRITYYHSERYYPKRRSKPEKTIVTYDLKKVFSDSLHVVLKDSVSYGGRVMKLNNTNDFIYASDVFRTDSVSFEKNEFNMAYKKYWYKKSRSKEYKLGQEKQADCNGLISDVAFDTYDNSQVICDKSTFEYDAMARRIHALLYNGYSYVNVFYTYNPQGLVEKRFQIEADYALIFTYRYR